MWIEIKTFRVLPIGYLVTSLAEVWIEIFVVRMHRYIMQSLPLRKCGLKYHCLLTGFHTRHVTSLAEVWIEIMFCCVNPNCNLVTSLAEVWIEIW